MSEAFGEMEQKSNVRCWLQCEQLADCRDADSPAFYTMGGKQSLAALVTNDHEAQEAAMAPRTPGAAYPYGQEEGCLRQPLVTPEGVFRRVRLIRMVANP